MSQPSAIVEPATLRDLFRAHAAFVARSLSLLGVAGQDVEDAVHEVFLVAARRLSEYEERGSIRSWLWAICLYVARSRRQQRQRREEPMDEHDLGPADAPTPEQTAHRRQSFERAKRALDALSDEQREAFVLYEVEQLTLREVAESMGCAIQTVYSRVQAARARLRQALGVEVLAADGADAL